MTLLSHLDMGIRRLTPNNNRKEVLQGDGEKCKLSVSVFKYVTGSDGFGLNSCSRPQGPSEKSKWNPSW
jgi:hypothetical protein